MVNTGFASLVIADDGFLWFEGRKLPCKVKPGGLEFYEKDPRRAGCAGRLFIVPFEALLCLARTAGGVSFNAEVIEIHVPDGGE